MCVSVIAIVWTPFIFLEAVFFWSVIMILYIRNLLLICKIVLIEGAGLLQRCIVQENHIESDYNDWVNFFFFCNAWIRSKINN